MRSLNSAVLAFRRLPADAAIELSRLIERLAATVPHRKIDWSDSWSDKDLKEFRAASFYGLKLLNQRISIETR